MLEKEKKSKVTRNLPIRVVCPNTRHRIINQVIYEEFISSLWSGQESWEDVAQLRLKEYDINVSSGVLKSYKAQIKSGVRNPISSSNFGNSLFGGSFSSRYGKDSMYGQFSLWEKIYLKEDRKVYVGLPANQILFISQLYGPENVFACDSNEYMIKFMSNLQVHFSQEPYANVFYGNIFDFLSDTDVKFSVYDLDLMCHANSPGLVSQIARSVTETSKDRAVVNVATSVGRWISEEDYLNIMPNDLVCEIEKCGFKVVDVFSGGYNDRIIPMKYEFLAIERKKK